MRFKNLLYKIFVKGERLVVISGLSRKCRSATDNEFWINDTTSFCKSEVEADLKNKKEQGRG